MSERANNPFWEFSLAVYGRTGVASACVGLQDRRGLDVNLLLFACWAGYCGGRRLDRDEWRRMIDSSAAWRVGVVEPLRAIRRRLKEDTWPGISSTVSESLRQQVKSLELGAEHAEQIALTTIMPVEPRNPGSTAEVLAPIRANLAGYVAAAGVGTDAADRADLELLAKAADDTAAEARTRRHTKREI